MSQNEKQLTEDIKVLSVDDLKDCRKNIKVEVSSGLSKKYIDESLSKFSKDISLPGFRKGKVPKEFLKEKFKDALKEKWSDDLAQHVCQIVLKSLNIKLISPAVYSWIDVNDLDKSFLELSMETYPDIPAFDLKDLKPKTAQKVKEVSAKEVDEKLASYIHTICDWEEVSKITKDTRVTFSMVKNNENICEKKILGLLDKELRDAIKSMKVSESKEVEIDGTLVQITLDKIEKAKNIDLAEEKLIERFNVKDIDSLKEVIKDRVQKHKESEFIESCKKVIYKQFSTFFSFNLPKSLVDSEVKARSSELRDKSDTALEEIKKESEDALRAFFVIEHISEKHNVSLSEQSKNFLLSQQSRYKNKNNMAMERMAAQLLSHEVLVFLIKSFNWIS